MTRVSICVRRKVVLQKDSAVLAPCLIALPAAQAQNLSLDVFNMGADQHIHQLSATVGSTWKGVDITAAAGAPLGASGSLVTGFYDIRHSIFNVFYIGTDQHIHNLYSTTGATWSHVDMSAQAGAPAASIGTSLTAFDDARNNYLDVFYVGTDQHVHNLYAAPGSNWVHVDVTAQAGGAATATSGSLTSFADFKNNYLNVFYVGNDQDLHNLYATPGSTWTHVNMTAQAGGPLAATGSSLTSFDNFKANNLNAFYVGTDQHVHNLYATPGTNWSHVDMTAQAGGANALGGGSLTSFDNFQGNNLNAFYVGIDQHVHNLYAVPGTNWNHVDMTAQAGGANALAGGSLTSFDNFQGNNVNVYYAGTDQHVHNFYATPGTGWNNVDMTAQSGGPAAGAGLTSWAGSGISLLLAGKVTSGSHVVPGVAVTLGGTISMASTSDANGNYSFVVPAGGTYTITSSLSGYTFNPPVQTISNAVSTTGGQTANFANIGTVTVNNLTHTSWGSAFAVGDTLQISISNAVPNQSVSVTTSGASNGTTQMGQTDSNGNFTYTATEQASGIGSFTEIWSVGGVPSTPAISFLVGQLNSGGTITTTDAGQTSDGNLEGVSTLSITNGVVSTYSATTLDHTASAFYDTYTVATLFDNATAITQKYTAVTTNTTTTLSATANAWDDYDLQTDHYAVAFFVSGSGYSNPLYWGDSCSAETGDCTIGAGGGFAYWVSVAYIYVGSTLADQTNVPQDGSSPVFSDPYAWRSFGSGQTLPPGIESKVTVWEAIVIATADAVALAESNYKRNNQNYPIPKLLELTADTPVGTKERDRTYLIKDNFGHAWDQHHGDITVYEQFIKVFGTGGLPDANNPAFRNDGWSKSNKSISRDGYMVDQIANLFPQPEVDYLQSFWATGITTPPGLILPPGIAALGLPGGGLQIPLFVRDNTSNCKTGDFSLQGIEINAQFIGINGDGGHGTSCLPPR